MSLWHVPVVLNWSLSPWIWVESTWGTLDLVEGTQKWSMTPRNEFLHELDRDWDFSNIQEKLNCDFSASLGHISFTFAVNNPYSSHCKFLHQIFTQLIWKQSHDILRDLGVIDHCGVHLTWSNPPRVDSTCTRGDTNQFSTSASQKF